MGSGGNNKKSKEQKEINSLIKILQLSINIRYFGLGDGANVPQFILGSNGWTFHIGDKIYDFKITRIK